MKKITLLLVAALWVLAINNLSAQIPADDPVVHFEFNNSLVAKQATYTLGATTVSDLKYVEGADGTANGAISNLGPAEYLETTAPFSITGNTSRTITTWIKTSATENGAAVTQREIVNMGTADNFKKFTLMLIQNKVRNDIKAGGHSTPYQSFLNDDEWHFLAVVYYKDPTVNDNGTSTIYVDGVVKGSYNFTSTQVINTGAAPLLIGNQITAPMTAKDRGFEGAIDDVRVYDSALTAGNIQSMYDEFLDNTTFTGLGVDDVWNNSSNWNNGVPTSSKNASIPAGMSPEIGTTTAAAVNDLTVDSGATLKINSGGTLIVSGTSTGDVTYNRDLPSEDWYLVSSPVSGQIYDTDYMNENAIIYNLSNNNVGIATYTTSNNGWDYYQITSSSGGTFVAGTGYSVKRSSTGVISFKGTINTADVTTPTLAAGFNLLGNPYTSFVDSKVFLDAASANIDKTQMWVWNAYDGNYDVKINGDAFVLAPAQGFFVKAIGTGTETFSKSNQATTGGAFQKTAKTEIKLLLTDGTNERFAKIYLTDTATTGFDSGWEGETFGGIANNVDVFTHLVADNQGKKYQVQSLPISEMESMIIPVGVVAEAGKELTFSLEQTNFPTDVKVYLEDRVANTFNELTESKTFKVTLSDALNDVGRFYLHASKSVLSADDALALNGVSMYKSNATTLKVVGLPNGASNIKLFNILGKQVLNTSFIANGVKEITLSKLAKGIYIVQLETETSKLNKKIVLK